MAENPLKDFGTEKDRIIVPNSSDDNSSFMTNGNNITLYGEYPPDLMKLLINKIEDIISRHNSDMKCIITISICSAGGATELTFALVRFMQKLEEAGIAEFHVYGHTLVGSAATFILAAATKAKLVFGTQVLLHSTVMTDNDGSLIETIGVQKMTHLSNKEAAKLYARRGKFSVEEFTALLDNTHSNYVFTAEKAVEIGLADEVV